VEPIKVGVVGVGYLGQFHAEKYSKIEGVELVGVVDIDPSRAKEIAKRVHTSSFFRHSEIFDRVQAASIAVPTPLHHGVARDLLLHGIDLLVEKPICCTVEEADELIELSDARGLILQVGHSERFNGALLAVEGRIQNPLLIDSSRLSPFLNRATDVDVVIDLMIHDLDIVFSWVRSGVTALHAVGASVVTPHVDIANARIEFENGCVANFTASRISPEKVRRTRVFQPGGYFSIDYLSQKAVFTEKRGGSNRGESQEMASLEFPVRKTDSLEIEIQSFLQSVRSRKPPRVSGRDGRCALEVALQIDQRIRDHTRTHEAWQRSNR
jgi:predicted dehydrogenase